MNPAAIRTMQQNYQFHYLPEAPEERLWGVKLCGFGSGIIETSKQYPPAGHPEGYVYSWESGRILDEYQIIVISEGQGEFESKSAGHVVLTAPCIFVLFPDEWHRYRSSLKTGWTEHWIGFSGDYAESVIKGIMQKENPVIRLKESPHELIELTDKLLETAEPQEPKRSIDTIMSTLRMIGCLHDIQIQRQAEWNLGQKKIAEARMIILARFNEKLDWDELASRLGMSTSTFRRQFLESTGLPPFQYQTKIRLNRAKKLLAAGKRVSEVSDYLGYSSPYHFSNLFSQREGLSPRAYIQKQKTRLQGIRSSV